MPSEIMRNIKEEEKAWILVGAKKKNLVELVV